MKKTVIILFAVCGLAFVACKKEGASSGGSTNGGTTASTGGTDSSAQDIKQATQKFYDAFNAHNVDGMMAMVDSGYVEHSLTDGQKPGAEGMREFMGMLIKAYPDLKATVLGMVNEGDKIGVAVRMTGTNTGEFMGMKPTGKAMDVMGVDWLVIKNGKATEHWGYMEEAKMMQQLGLIPPPPGGIAKAGNDKMAVGGGGNSAVEANKAMCKKFYEIASTGKFDEIDSMIDANFVDNNPSPGQKPGLAGLKAAFTDFRKGFPDLKMEVVDIIGEGDMVMVLVHMMGTNSGEMMGMKPTGKKMDVMGVDIIRFAGGKATERWGYAEEAKMMKQLGMGGGGEGGHEGAAPGGEAKHDSAGAAK